MSADYPDLLFVHARGDGGPRPRTQIIIIHATANTATASAEASFATRREDGISAHYYVDGSETIQALPIGNIAYGALWHGNQVSVQYELCGRSNQLGAATIGRAAAQVARDCARYGVPIRKLSPAEIRAGARGICGHADVTLAWPEDGGDHTDPGASFPWSQFIKQVQQAGEIDMGKGVDEPGLDVVANRSAEVLLSDVWGQEQFADSVFVDGLQPSLRSQQIASTYEGVQELLSRPPVEVTLTPEQLEEVKATLAEPIAELVAAKLAARLQS